MAETDPCRRVPTRRPSPQHEWDGPRALQHRRGRLRQAPGGQARDDPRGLRRAPSARSRWGELQELVQPLRQRAARARRRAGRPRRDAAAADARDRGGVLRHLEVRARSCSRCRCSTATTASATACRDSQAKVLVTNAANQDRVDPSLVEHVLLLDDELLASGDAAFDARRHRRRRPGAALLHVRHDRAGQGHRARAPLPARARGVRLLPRRAGRRALPRHGRVGVGGGHRAAARAVALRRRAARLPARGRLRPAQAARLPLPPRGDERLHDADRDALDDGDRGRRHALPAEVPHRLLAPASR